VPHPFTEPGRVVHLCTWFFLLHHTAVPYLGSQLLLQVNQIPEPDKLTNTTRRQLTCYTPAMHPTQYFTYPVLSLAIPALVAFITTMLVIKYGPNRGEVSRLAKLVQGIVDDQGKEKKLNHFRCDVSLENLVEEGSRVTFTSATPFRLLQVKIANANRAPFHTATVDSGIGTTQSCIVPHDAINKVYWSTQGTTTKDAVLLFAVEIADIILHREQAVSLLQLSFQRTGDPTFRQFVRMS
jgi:hypothetical protein